MVKKENKDPLAGKVGYLELLAEVTRIITHANQEGLLS